MARRKKKRVSVFGVLMLLVLVCVALALAFFRPKGDPTRVLQAELEDLRLPNAPALTGIDAEIADAYASCLRLTLDGPLSQSFYSASGSVTRTTLDASLLTAGLAEEIQAALAEKAAAAKRSSDLYTADGAILPELYDAFYNTAMRSRLARAEDYCRNERLPVTMEFTGGEWHTDAAGHSATATLRIWPEGWRL